MSNPTPHSSPPPGPDSTWQALLAHRGEIGERHLAQLFASDPARAARMQAEACGLFLDYSKNRVTGDTLALLFELAREAGLDARRAAMFDGERINRSEGRAVLHTALRRPADECVMVDGRNVVADIAAVRERCYRFAEAVRDGAWRGYDGRAITDVVHIGIGGSDLGPLMVCEALKPCAHPRLRMHFVSNVDGVQIGDVLCAADPGTTLFIVASKTFTTQETLANAHTARRWLIERSGDETVIARHFAAVSTHPGAVTSFGIDPANMFGFWDWVGGRYSLWSAIGLPIVLQIGAAGFDALLAGARAMDLHFREAPFERNLPVILALTGIWNIDFLGAPSQLIAPYHQRLHRLPAFLQQLDMESNGKSVKLDGSPAGCQTSPVIWGESGINGQHAYFQMLHQGTQLVPTDFIGVLEAERGFEQHHRIAFANLVAQAEALMRGKSAAEAEAEMRAAGMAGERIRALLPHRVFPGNRPSNALLMARLDPYTLGALIALYEHRTFVQGVVWGLNSFDQWGVELGKQLAARVLDDLAAPADLHAHDASTAGLIARYRACAVRQGGD
ncbi:glucose-6-phosphate isomerase [Thauera linaloolentis]|uniref:Glucose-6-phosphate isomerase n=1 Tax=Thauera linaloolentis (strain DSM 12138 / JCM 21573 / CCUG 41526 / CIP 105981 / IAM 15112 / NBRC 102519 / 47Lol) TaxID=1123367 RepID=N6YQK4_THAL4|nr:glucose-6-phosphate isomerase [Thauera linaloolentis]ENO84503.1 glucose-6-phosphate isomerase [Thauera linaloolentis 47Lol = DSM 12138]MCM8566702.1 glucose-6-phosphate isomerase [Thauera linaloolentis]